MMEITSLLPGTSGVSGAAPAAKPARSNSDTSFSDALSDALDRYRQIDNEGDYATLNLLSGNTDDLSQAMIATEKSELALDFTVAVRNKAVEAYKEIMNMQV